MSSESSEATSDLEQFPAPAHVSKSEENRPATPEKHTVENKAGILEEMATPSDEVQLEVATASTAGVAKVGIEDAEPKGDGDDLEGQMSKLELESGAAANGKESEAAEVICVR